jgi:hypothetical protein
MSRAILRTSGKYPVLAIACCTASQEELVLALSGSFLLEVSKHCSKGTRSCPKSLADKSRGQVGVQLGSRGVRWYSNRPVVRRGTQLCRCVS